MQSYLVLRETAAVVFRIPVYASGVFFGNFGSASVDQEVGEQGIRQGSGGRRYLAE